MSLQVVEAQEAHVHAMSGRFRPGDIAELWAAAHQTPEEAMLVGLRLSPLCWTALVDGSPVAMFGVSPASMLGGIGCPWMVGTVEVDRNARNLMILSRPMVARMLATFPHLVNFVDVRNTKAIGWLKRLGFAFSPAAPYGMDGLLFHRFEMGGENV